MVIEIVILTLNFELIIETDILIANPSVSRK